MANKQILSVVAATILAASFTFTGCGSSSSSSSSSSAGTVSSGAAVSSDGGSTSSEATEPISVTAFKLLEASVTKGGTESAIVDGTMYEFPEGTTGIIASLGGAYDSNGDNNATAEDANAPALAAKATFSNVHGLSTLEAQGVSIDDINTLYNLELNSTDIAIDPLDVPVYAANAKAVLRLSGYPGDGQATSSTAPASSEAASSSSVDASNPYPGAVLRSPFPDQPSSAAEASSEAAASSSSEAASGGTAYADIDACTDAVCIDAVTGAELINLNGVYDTASSSSNGGETSSNMETSSEAASSSSVDASNPYPAPAL